MNGEKLGVASRQPTTPRAVRHDIRTIVKIVIQATGMAEFVCNHFEVQIAGNQRITTTLPSPATGSPRAAPSADSDCIYAIVDNNDVDVLAGGQRWRSISS